jgi:metal-dependent hydrolase (beta-lactamase superfamily II)
MAAIVEQFRELGVEKCGAGHCTGEEQIAAFEAAYGDDFVPIGAGKVLTFSAPE